MQDIMAKLQSILSTPEGQSQLNNITSMLNNQNSQNSPPAQNNSMPDLSAIQNIISGLNNNSSPAPPQNNAVNQPDMQASGLAGIDMNMILKLQQIMGSMKVSDKNSQLLLSLKPHFGEKRQAKVDQALNIMKLISVLPALKESGILGGIL